MFAAMSDSSRLVERMPAGDKPPPYGEHYCRLTPMPLEGRG